MPRMRIIKPEFWSDEKIGQLSIIARLLYIGLWNLSDDYGVVKGNATWVKGQLFPYDDKEPTSKSVRRALDELSSIDRIRKFDDNGETYYYITTFNIHQKIDKPSKTKNPTPPRVVVEYSPSTRRVVDAEVEVEVEGELSRSEVKGSEVEVKSGKPDDVPFEEIVSDLNQVCGKKYRFDSKQTQSHIMARWSEGFRVVDFKAVHRNKASSWLGDAKMSAFLRPETLYSGKFESYLNDVPTKSVSDVTRRNMANYGDMLKKLEDKVED